MSRGTEESLNEYRGGKESDAWQLLVPSSALTLAVYLGADEMTMKWALKPLQKEADEI